MGVIPRVWFCSAFTGTKIVNGVSYFSLSQRACSSQNSVTEPVCNLLIKWEVIATFFIQTYTAKFTDCFLGQLGMLMDAQRLRMIAAL